MLLSLALARLLLDLVEAQFDKRQVLALRRQQLPRLLQQRRQRGLLAARWGGGPVHGSSLRSTTDFAVCLWAANSYRVSRVHA
jgi:hypothetical protein